MSRLHASLAFAGIGYHDVAIGSWLAPPTAFADFRVRIPRALWSTAASGPSMSATSIDLHAFGAC